jgi:hypothetical protein
MPSSSFLRLLASGSTMALLLILSRVGVARAKLQSGKVHLSGVKTESTLVKFAVPASSSVELIVNVTSYGMYVNEKELRLRVYVDDEWPTVRREPLCREKVKHALLSIPIVFDYKGKLQDDRHGGNKKNKKNNNMVEMYESRVRATLDNPPRPKPDRSSRSSRPPVPRKDRSRYFYFAIDDCSIEESCGDDKVPDAIYSASVRNGRRPPPADDGDGGGGRETEVIYDHLPADEDGIRPLLLMTLAFSVILLAVLFLSMARTMSMAGGGGGGRGGPRGDTRRHARVRDQRTVGALRATAHAGVPQERVRQLLPRCDVVALRGHVRQHAVFDTAIDRGGGGRSRRTGGEGEEDSSSAGGGEEEAPPTGR